MDKGRRCGGGIFFDHFERNHLACNLGEALDAPQNGHKAALIQINDVAGGIPARATRRWRLDYARVVVQQIAFHHVWPLDVQRTAALNARHGLQLVCNAGQQLADGADLASHGHIHGYYGCAFGHAIAFENADAEFFDPEHAHVFREFFSARHHIAQAAKVVRVGVLAVMPQKGRGAKQHGAVAVIHDFGDDPIVQRAGVEKHLAARHQWQHHAAGQAERVKQRQRHHEFVARSEVGHGANLRHVRQHRIVRMHHALGLAFGAGGE